MSNQIIIEFLLWLSLSVVIGWYGGWRIYFWYYRKCWPSAIWYRRRHNWMYVLNDLSGWHDIPYYDLRNFWYSQPISYQEWTNRSSYSGWIASRSAVSERLPMIKFARGHNIVVRCRCHSCTGHTRWISSNLSCFWHFRDKWSDYLAHQWFKKSIS